MTQQTENEQPTEAVEVDAPVSEAAAVVQAETTENGTPEMTLEEQLAHAQERASGYLEELQRERASFINYRRRTELERENWAREANAALIFNVLPVLDDFERARVAIPAEYQESAWVDGLMLVGRKLDSTLELAGLRQIEAVGKPFDPSRHEAVSVQPPDEAESGLVVEEYRKGYMLGDRVLRPSMVRVTG
ncbi:MAG: nucleotide exchange factor GrpE [Chloroflexota bacterium]|nr:nucleotide exchange factor GrpE [Chloroflexota bacterium]